MERIPPFVLRALVVLLVSYTYTQGLAQGKQPDVGGANGLLRLAHNSFDIHEYVSIYAACRVSSVHCWWAKRGVLESLL
jgi:hypothetical protein